MNVNSSFVKLETSELPSSKTPYPPLEERHSFFDPFRNINRDLLIWYPAENVKEKRSVIILSHGYNGTPHDLYWMIEELVQKGFIVMGVKHIDIDDEKIHINHWQRARDIHLIIDAFSSSEQGQRADLSKIGIAGFSLGGTTAIWVSGGRSTKLNTLVPPPGWASETEFGRIDEALPLVDNEKMRQYWGHELIQASFVMAPAWAWLFEEEKLKEISIPFYITAGSADSIVSAQHNAGFFKRTIEKAIYEEIPEAGHFTFIDRSSLECKLIQLKIAEKAADFFKHHLK